jgi:hypothetical protein
MLKPWDLGEQQFSACYLIFILVVWGNLQWIPSRIEKWKNKHSFKVVKSLVGKDVDLLS